MVPHLEWWQWEHKTQTYVTCSYFRFHGQWGKSMNVVINDFLNYKNRINIILGLLSNIHTTSHPRSEPVSTFRVMSFFLFTCLWSFFDLNAVSHLILVPCYQTKLLLCLFFACYLCFCFFFTCHSLSGPFYISSGTLFSHLFVVFCVKFR